MGRVLSDGLPVEKFDVVAVRRARDPWKRRSFVTRDGCFALADLEPGRWRLVIDAGAMIRGLEVVVTEGTIVSVGDVKLAHGFTVRGHVVDQTGAVVPRATVTLAMVPGERSHAADSLGRFHFDDINAGHGPAGWTVYVTAAAPGGLRSPLVEAVPDVPVQLVVMPTGAIEGTISGLAAGDYVYFSGGRGASTVAQSAANGMFHVDDVLPGNYVVRHDGKHKEVTLGNVHVDAGQTAEVMFVAPPDGIDVAVHSQSACKDVVLRTSPGLEVARTTCTGPRAWLQGVPLGKYQLCVDGVCRNVDIDDMHDSFELP